MNVTELLKHHKLSPAMAAALVESVENHYDVYILWCGLPTRSALVARKLAHWVPTAPISQKTGQRIDDSARIELTVEGLTVARALHAAQNPPKEAPVTETAIERLTLTTPELHAGDIVLEHGMRVRLPAAPRVYPNYYGAKGTTVYAWDGTVENLEEVLAAGLVSRGMLSDSRWVEGQGWVHELTGKWVVQGNQLARWGVERVTEGA